MSIECPSAQLSSGFMAKKLEGDNMSSAPLLLFTAVISLLLCIGEGFFCVVFLSGVQKLDSVPPRLSLVWGWFFPLQ